MTEKIAFEQSKKIYNLFKKLNIHLPFAKSYWYDCYPDPLPKDWNLADHGEYRIYRGRDQKDTKTISKILMIYPAWTLEELNDILYQKQSSFDEFIDYIEQYLNSRT